MQTSSFTLPRIRPTHIVLTALAVSMGACAPMAAAEPEPHQTGDHPTIDQQAWRADPSIDHHDQDHAKGW